MDAISTAQGVDRSMVRLRLFERFPNAAPIVLGVVLVSAIAALDWATGSEVSVSLLYVLVVMAVTWSGTRRHGVLVAVLAAVESLAAHIAAGGFGVIPVRVIWNATSRLVVLVLVAALLGSLRNALMRLRRQAMVDPLTGAFNRRAFQVTAERERLRAGRDGGPLSLAYFDLDGFKTYNDRFGHTAGDDLLALLAETVRQSIRATDLFARMGGDEFVVLLPDTDAREAMVVINRVQTAWRGQHPEPSTVTTSVGIATYRFPPNSVDALIAGADDLMYQAKARGGNTVLGTVVVGPWTRWQDHINLTRPAETTRLI